MTILVFSQCSAVFMVISCFGILVAYVIQLARELRRGLPTSSSSEPNRCCRISCRRMCRCINVQSYLHLTIQVATLIAILLFFLHSLLLALSLFLSFHSTTSCRKYNLMRSFAHQIGKVNLYFVFIARLHAAFHGSSQEVSRRILCVLYSALAVFVLVVAIGDVIFVQGHLGQRSRCLVRGNSFQLSVMGVVDVLFSVSTLLLFVRKLIILIQNSTRDNSDIMYLVHKYAILVIVASISNTVFLSAFIIDTPTSHLISSIGTNDFVNSLCLFLIFRQNNSSYEIFCFPCRKFCSFLERIFCAFDAPPGLLQFRNGRSIQILVRTSTASPPPPPANQTNIIPRRSSIEGLNPHHQNALGKTHEVGRQITLSKAINAQYRLEHDTFFGASAITPFGTPEATPPVSPRVSSDTMTRPSTTSGNGSSGMTTPVPRRDSVELDEKGDGGSPRRRESLTSSPTFVMPRPRTASDLDITDALVVA